ncbi:MAG TPA: M24 family metallopeptidase [Fimbriimonadaceae bacterium]|nr:M24 family metallopeptidase [Fimbriimonadaceae bacterium]
MGTSLTREKLAQAARLVREAGVDVWMVFDRETAECGDPVLPLILDGGLTWQSALMVTRDGKKIAVLGNYDAEPLVHSGDWDEVVPYVQGIKEPLLEVLDRVCGPSPKIAVDFSLSNDKADGLSHGMFLLLSSYFEGTSFEGSLVSAEEIVSSLRSRKTPEEVRRIKHAIKCGDEVFAEISRFARLGVSETDVFTHAQAFIDGKGWGYGWDRSANPIVNSGPDSMVGHGKPSPSVFVSEGHVFHIDLGVVVDGYSSDIQRCWYVGSSLPADVVAACDAVNKCITLAADVLKPGVQGWEIDAIARRTIVECGYEEYMHALGHQVGRQAHDGGTVLAPRWERYGTTPVQEVCKDEVYTLELGVFLPERGYLGFEEIVVVTESGCEFLSERQTSIPRI